MKIYDFEGKKNICGDRVHEARCRHRLTQSDLAARLLFLPYELPVGILMSVLGGPFFLGLLLKQKGGRAHA